MKSLFRSATIIIAAVILATAGGNWLQPSQAQSVIQTLRTASVNDDNAPQMTANFIRIRDTTEEFILDFGTNDEAPAAPKKAIKIEQRLVLTPQTAKRLLIALEVTIGGHERTFGKIETDPARRVQPSP